MRYTIYLAITAERRSAVLTSQYLWFRCAVSYVVVTVGYAVVEIRITVAPDGAVSLPEAKHSSPTGCMGKTKQPLAPRNAPTHPNPRFFFLNHFRREVHHLVSSRAVASWAHAAAHNAHMGPFKLP